MMGAEALFLLHDLGKNPGQATKQWMTVANMSSGAMKNA